MEDKTQELSVKQIIAEILDEVSDIKVRSLFEKLPTIDKEQAIEFLEKYNIELDTVKSEDSVFPILSGFIYKDLDNPLLYVWCPQCRTWHAHGASSKDDLPEVSHRMSHCVRDDENRFNSYYVRALAIIIPEPKITYICRGKSNYFKVLDFPAFKHIIDDYNIKVGLSIVKIRESESEGYYQLVGEDNNIGWTLISMGKDEDDEDITLAHLLRDSYDHKIIASDQTIILKTFAFDENSECCSVYCELITEESVDTVDLEEVIMDTLRFIPSDRHNFEL